MSCRSTLVLSLVILAVLYSSCCDIAELRYDSLYTLFNADDAEFSIHTKDTIKTNYNFEINLNSETVEWCNCSTCYRQTHINMAFFDKISIVLDKDIEYNGHILESGSNILESINEDDIVINHSSQILIRIPDNMFSSVANTIVNFNIEVPTSDNDILIQEFSSYILY